MLIFDAENLPSFGRVESPLVPFKTKRGILSGEFYIDAENLKKLGKSFETRSYDLLSYVKTFRRETDAEVIHDGFGLLTESEEVTSAYIDLSNDTVNALKKLGRHLDEVGEALKQNAKNSEEADGALSEMFKGGSR